MTYIALLIAAFLLSLAGTKYVLSVLTRMKALDIPNARSNHKIPTPRGGGIAVVFSIAAVLAAYTFTNTEDVKLITGLIAASSVLALLSFLDDVRPLPAFVRFTGHIIVVLVSVYGFGMLNGFIFQGLLPSWLDPLAAAFLWIWCINLYNFMDGIDGITTVETASISLGVFLVAILTTLPVTHIVIAMVLLGSVLGFGVYNWHPAKIFMGDVGSIPLGYLVGYLLLSTAAQGYWAIALILPAYYLYDSTYTILKRLIERKNIFQAHSEHFYQKAVRSGKSHSHVALTIAVANGKLILLALISAWYGLLVPELTLAAVVIAAIVLYFSQRGKNA